MSTAVIWSKSKQEVGFQYGGRLGESNGMSSQSYVTHCRVEEHYLLSLFTYLMAITFVWFDGIFE